MSCRHISVVEASGSNSQTSAPAKVSPPSQPIPVAPLKFSMISRSRKKKYRSRSQMLLHNILAALGSEQLQHWSLPWEWSWRTVVKGNLPSGQNVNTTLVTSPTKEERWLEAWIYMASCAMTNGWPDGQEEKLWRKGMWMDLSKQVQMKKIFEFHVNVPWKVTAKEEDFNNQ